MALAIDGILHRVFWLAFGLEDAESGELIIVNAIMSLPPLAYLAALIVLTIIAVSVVLAMICSLGYCAWKVYRVVARKEKWSVLLPVGWFVGITIVVAVAFTFFTQ